MKSVETRRYIHPFLYGQISDRMTLWKAGGHAPVWYISTFIELCILFLLSFLYRVYRVFLCDILPILTIGFVVMCLLSVAMVMVWWLPRPGVKSYTRIHVRTDTWAMRTCFQEYTKTGCADFWRRTQEDEDWLNAECIKKSKGNPDPNLPCSVLY